MSSTIAQQTLESLQREAALLSPKFPLSGGDRRDQSDPRCDWCWCGVASPLEKFLKSDSGFWGRSGRPVRRQATPRLGVAKRTFPIVGPPALPGVHRTRPRASHAGRTRDL